MTVNIIILSAKRVIMAADCRFLNASDNTLKTDAAPKILTFRNERLVVALTYCGIGESEWHTTHDRLAKWLTGPHADGLSFDELILVIERETSLWLRQLSQKTRIQDIRHTFSIGGYETGQVVGALVSNCITLPAYSMASTATEVKTYRIPISKPRIIVVGADKIITRNQDHMLKKLARLNRSLDEVAVVVSSITTDLSRNALTHNRISSNCFVQIIGQSGHTHGKFIGKTHEGFKPRTVDSLFLGIDLREMSGLTKTAVISQILTAHSSRESWPDPSVQCAPRTVRPWRVRNHEACRYKLVELPSLGGFTSNAQRLNETGLAGGSSAPEGRGPSVACAWHEGQVHRIDTLGGIASGVGGVNSQGVIVGVARDSEDVDTAFTWTIEGGIQRIFQKNDLITAAKSINDNGTIVGWMRPQADRSISGDHMGLFLCKPLRQLVQTVDVLPNVAIEPIVINQSGEIIATATMDNRRVGLFFKSDGQLIILTGPMDGETSLVDINDGGVVLGLETLEDQTINIFKWSFATGFEAIGGVGSARPAAINNAGVIALNGESDGVRRSYLWESNKMKILPYYKDHASHVFDLNDAGVAVGQMSSDYHCHAVCWVPA